MNYKPYLEFIRYVLNPKRDMPKDVAKMDWEGFFQFADEQGILGLMFDGRRKMEEGRVKKNWLRIRRDIRMMRYFPSECLWEPVFRVYHFFWRQRYN